ncbi:hypothetical protein GLYMA_05G064050v4 [Glycine max]|nr:hypothetical protein GLYMA_05G064050v4 [Glycine max]KAH1133090.1 hypothetical protein GYH30_011774 [Glycine max]
MTVWRHLGYDFKHVEWGVKEDLHKCRTLILFHCAWTVFASLNGASFHQATAQPQLFLVVVVDPGLPVCFFLFSSLSIFLWYGAFEPQLSWQFAYLSQPVIIKCYIYIYIYI